MSSADMADNPSHEGKNEAIPRLMIKKIVMENFKSYGGIKEIGPFHKCFSSVIGPNGSGKSNVIDAMLFVFGRRANAIRLKKLSELIHNSAALPKCEKCSVAVHFCEIIDHPNSDDGYDVVPNSDFIVTRSVDRSSTSKYYFNDRPVSMNEVVTLLKNKGIDLDHNRFLILQGEVEQIAMMKPKQQQPGGEDGLLEYLEDIIGSNRHIPAITSAEQEVDALNEQREEKMNRVKLIEKEKNALEQSKDDAISCLKCALTLYQTACHVFQVRAAHQRQELASLTDQRDAVRERLAAEEEAVREIVETYVRVKGEYDAVSQEVMKVKGQLEKSKEHFNELNRRDTAITNGLTHNAQNVEAARTQQTQLETELKKLLKNHSRDQEALPELKKEIEELTAAKIAQDAEIEQIFEEVKQSTEQLRGEMEEISKKLLPLKQKVNDWTKSKLAITGEIRVLKESLGSAHADLETLTAERAKAERDLGVRREELTRLTDKLNNLYTSRTNIQRELQRVSGELAGVTAQFEKLHSEVAVTSEKQASNATRSVIARELERMKQQDPQTFGGVYGALGDLGYIDQKYDLAVSMATPQLRNIVVDTTRTAQACIDVCRRKNLGRATFICLDKLGRHEADMKKAFQVPLNAQRLFDLVTPLEPRFAVAFYSVMRNTVVADSLGIANTIAYGQVRHRVVTLQGEVIDVSGTMSGGGSGLARGLMSFTADKRASESSGKGDQDLRALENQLKEVSAKKQELEQTRMNLANQLKNLATDLRNTELGKQGSESAVGMLEEQLSNVTKLISERETVKDTSEKTRIRISQLEEKLQSVQLGEDDANSACVDLEREQAALKKRMLDKGGARLQKSKSKVEEIKKKMEAKKKEVMKLDIAIQNFDEKHSRLQADLQACAAEITTCEQQRATLEAERVEVEALALECMREYEGLETQLTELRASQTSKKTILDQSLTEKQRAEQKKKELEEQLKSLDEQIVRVQEILANVERKLEAKKKGCEKICDDLLKAMEDVNMEEVFFEVREAERKDNIDRKVKVALAAVEAKVRDEMIDEATAREMRAEAERVAIEEATALTMATMHELSEEEKQNYRQEVLQREAQFHREFGLKLLTEDEIARARLADLEEQVRVLELRLQDMQVNLTAIAEYRRKHQEYSVRQIQLESIVKQRDEAKAQYDALRKARLDEFMTGFSLISLKLKEMYQMLTLCGDAELELQDSADPFAEGIVFSVRPPKKSWKHIQNLSGGEKTLSSLALVFALHHYKPTPLYVMDEIDAALDFKNVSIVANYIKERTKNAQFIIISLRNNMFELADRLVGIYKTNNITKSVTIDPRCFEVEG